MSRSGRPEPIELYFDYVSHNAYLAWHRLGPLAAAAGRGVRAIPVVFGALLRAHRQLGPAEVPPKARWMVRDVARKAHDLALPLQPPASHPFLSLLALRVTTLATEEHERRAPALIAALFDAAWGRSLPIDQPSVVAETASSVGLEGESLVERATQPEIKAKLRDATDRALAKGVFGVPTMIADERLFWGFDDLVNLERYLEGEDPLESIDLSEWWRVRPSVERRR
ncbi:MAG TPA: 2-hydroxychromene-2-carboxylate isomerase [Thermoanaerobaculia bacterium]|nr:2-hydroxychromene-2-carboxylate isomerase [Thermoanaerobaculia bacterium]